MADQVSIGVIGAGGIARRKTIPGMLRAKNCKLAAVMDVANVDAIAAEFGARAYASEADLLADPEIQAVYIASPVNCHLKQIKQAAAAGKHVLSEKPLCMNAGEARQAVDACKKAGVFLQEGYMMKFHGAHRKIKELVEQGRLGKVVYMRAQLSCWYPPMEGAWRQDPALGGGGALIDMATHLYDLLEYFAGPAKRLVALTGNLVHGYKSDDASTTLLEFQSGAHGTVDSFFCIPDEASRTRLEIYGSKGAILTEGTIGQSNGGKVEGYFAEATGGYDAAQNKDVVRQFEPIAFDQINPYTAECEYFADCILNHREPEINSGKQGVHIMELTEKAYGSRVGAV
ncbi:MAG: Gfo/Idh/MocA family oxidoreductase [Rhodopirellula sp.]|nr:Gfo/Idh/MocA family oxidoreductase [Rhodopirellula sp.]